LVLAGRAALHLAGPGLLPATCCLPPAACHLPPVACCLLLVTNVDIRMIALRCVLAWLAAWPGLIDRSSRVD
jgi:hypothetical protein